MKLCIPTLCNYDGVDALVRSAEAGSVKPTGYVVLDNGGGYDHERLRAVLGSPADPALPGYISAHVVKCGENLGVAASWNYFLSQTSIPIVISNDDIVLGEQAFAHLQALAAQGVPRAGFGWALFMQSPECTEKVGYYDENFWPGYYEDIDYIIRMRRAGVADVRLEGAIDIHHAGWTTVHKLGDPAWLADGRAKNQSYLIAKWGTDDYGVPYAEPFNGKPPSGWDLRKRGPALPLRWDLINEIAEMIGAKTYLELGLADGSCIRRIKVPERTGVDMAAPPDVGDAVAFQCTTDKFFELNDRTFDLVFVDADHGYEQAARDVQNAIRCLNPGGVVVMHDCSPYSLDMQIVPHNGAHLWTGDVWKAIVRLRWEGQHATRVVDSNYGLGIVIPGGTPHHFTSRPRKPEIVTYEDLVADRENLLGLVSGWEWKAWFQAAYEPLKGAPLSPESQAELDRGVQSAKDSPSVYLGSFAYHAEVAVSSGELVAPVGPSQRDTLVVIFSKLPRADTTGTHLLKALERLVRVEYYDPLYLANEPDQFHQLPGAYESIDWKRARAVLCIDDDHGWDVPDPAQWTETTLPRYYWCIDTYRMDAALYLGGTRRERVKRFNKVFYVQKKEAEEYGGTWLPVGVDLSLYRHEPREKLYDFCFIGNHNHARAEFVERLRQEFPRSFVGTAYGEEANTIYNQSHIAFNRSAGNDINMRMFEGSATSALLLSNRIDNGEEELLPFTQLYDSFEECVAIMRCFIKNPATLRLLSLAQADEMLNHTYEVRARAFLEAIGWELRLDMSRFPNWQEPR